MVLFLSDVHFGREGRTEEREKESALIECLDAHADRVRHLYLLGDVFDGYIEYRHLIPKGFVRFQALLARWTDRGIPVTYLFGNHDSWHRDYFAQELGVTLVPETLDVTHEESRFRLAHGDAEASTHASYAWLRPLLRHPVAVGLYRSLLPADAGLALAHRVSRALYDPAPDPAVVRALRLRARALLDEEPFDSVVMGHSHEPVLHRWPEGVYVNTGNWYERRTFARLENGWLHLARWNGTRALDIESAEL